ncbi:MAG: hypothetical protein WDW38_007317 [Sanguina aurantia]
MRVLVVEPPRLDPTRVPAGCSADYRNVRVPGNRSDAHLTDPMSHPPSPMAGAGPLQPGVPAEPAEKAQLGNAGADQSQLTPDVVQLPPSFAEQPLSGGEASKCDASAAKHLAHAQLQR